MGQGLGENSPVVLSLGRGNYEALIKRHGPMGEVAHFQYVSLR